MIRLFLAGVGLLLTASAASAQVPCVDGQSAPTDDTSAAAAVGPFNCSEVDLLGHVPVSVFGSQRGNDIWGWTDPQTGREYALMGLDDGTGFVDVTDPSAPVVLGKMNTATVATVWRDIKVYKDHAFIVSEARNHGMQVFDLGRLRGLTADPARRFEPDAHYTGITNAHNIVINEETGFAYAVGAGSRGEDMPASCNAPGFHVINIASPLEPTFAGCFSDARKEQSAVSAPGYTHDAQCILYDGPDADYVGREVCSGSNEDVVTFFDVTDKSAVRIISQAAYPLDAYTHQGWFTEDRRYFLANDELDEQNGYVRTQRTLIFDVTNLDEPEFIYAHDSGLTTIDHNLYIKGNLAFLSNYESGLRIWDLSDIDNQNIVEVGHFDTYPPSTSVSFNGQWSNYPYFESGVVIANDINNGLFILQPSVTRRTTGSLH
jgi:choice-of-anchor B domain-containing protein